MATPLKANEFIALLDKWGIKWAAVKSTWATHNRKGHGDWEPVNGVMMHHTGSSGKTSDQNHILWYGYENLPGPLCHAGIATTGVLQLVGWGRANHAGLGSSATFNKVLSEDYAGTLKPGPASIDGNVHFYGFEIMYSGSNAMSDAQRIAAVKVAAALCAHHGWKAESVIGHGEWQQGKWDPGISKGKMQNMASFRDQVEQAIKEGPKPKQPTMYTAKKGDTLYSIATNKLGDGSRYMEIYNLNKNHLDSPDELPIGTKLVLPKK